MKKKSNNDEFLDQEMAQIPRAPHLYDPEAVVVVPSDIEEFYRIMCSRTSMPPMCGCCKTIVDGVSSETDKYGNGFCEDCFNVMIQLGHIEHGQCCYCENLTTWVAGDTIQRNCCDECWEYILEDIKSVNENQKSLEGVIWEVQDV